MGATSLATFYMFVFAASVYAQSYEFHLWLSTAVHSFKGANSQQGHFRRSRPSRDGRGIELLSPSSILTDKCKHN